MGRFFLILLAMVLASGCAWSTSEYKARGDDPPQVKHSGWSFGPSAPTSPTEIAAADAVGTMAKAQVAAGAGFGAGYGYGGYGNGMAAAGGFGPNTVGVFRTYPRGVPPNRIVRFSNHTGIWVRLGLNNFVSDGFIPPGEVVYLVSDSPHGLELRVCGYEAPGGACLGHGHRRLGFRMGRTSNYRAKRWLLHQRGACPLDAWARTQREREESTRAGSE